MGPSGDVSRRRQSAGSGGRLPAPASNQYLTSSHWSSCRAWWGIITGLLEGRGDGRAGGGVLQGPCEGGRVGVGVVVIGVDRYRVRHASVCDGGGRGFVVGRLHVCECEWV